MENVPLLVVDVQNGFINSSSDAVVPVVAALIEKWVSCKRPVYMSRFVNSEDSQWERLIHWKRLRVEPEIDLAPEVLEAARGRGIVFDKSTYTSVVGQFKKDLAAADWSQVAVCGIASDGCVLATALSLFEHPRAIRPLVVSDACASHAGSEIHRAGMLLIGRFIGNEQVITSADLLS